MFTATMPPQVERLARAYLRYFLFRAVILPSVQLHRLFYFLEHTKFLFIPGAIFAYVVMAFDYPFS